MTSDLSRFARHAATLPFPDSDVTKMVAGRAKVLTYPELRGYHSLEQLMRPHDAVIILYMSKPHYGHWTAFMRQHDAKGDEWLEFFDPYGKPMDSQLSTIDPQFARESHQDQPWLTNLVEDSPLRNKLFWNKTKLQHASNSISTCGRWAALRVGLRNWPLKLFINVFQGKDSDLLATILTSKHLQQTAWPVIEQAMKKSGGRRITKRRGRR